jgi:hypothetical protein
MSITDFVSNGEYAEAVAVCTEMEIRVQSNNSTENLNAFYSTYLGSLLVTGDFLGAMQLCSRLELYRILENVESGEAGGGESQQKYPDLWIMRALAHSLNQGDLMSAYQILNSSNLSAWLLPVKRDTLGALLAVQMRSIGAAYTIISVADLAKRLNMAPAQAVQTAQQWGWTLDPARNEFVQPRPVEGGVAFYQESADLVQKLGKYMSHFEESDLSVKLSGKSGGGTRGFGVFGS